MTLPRLIPLVAAGIALAGLLWAALPLWLAAAIWLGGATVTVAWLMVLTQIEDSLMEDNRD